MMESHYDFNLVANEYYKYVGELLTDLIYCDQDISLVFISESVLADIFVEV